MARLTHSCLLRDCLMVCLLALVAAPTLGAYSVLAHEQIIDTVWDQIQSLLLKRFPQSTPDQLRQAHAYAYGGAIIQDLGYYPFGSRFFGDLLHYVRSGDFVANSIADSQDLNEYAFALGTMAHYAADNLGHPIATNPSVAIEFPKLRKKFGLAVTYGQDPVAHVKTEFGFDVIELAQGNYAPQSYHDFIGFEVSRPLLERAFRDTYSLELTDVFFSVDLALGTYRHAVSRTIPNMTKAAWTLKKNELVSAHPGLTRRRFVYNLSRASYEKEWGREYEKPGAGARFLAFLFRLIPKVGPFKAVDFKPPTVQTQQLFMDSFNRTLALYRELLGQQGGGQIHLENRDFDTGVATRPGEYPLADHTYAKLTRALSRKDPGSVNLQIRDNIIEFYKNLDAPIATKQKPQEWHDTLGALAKLSGQPATSR